MNSFINHWVTYGSEYQNGAVVLSAIAALWIIIQNKSISKKRGTLDLILHQQSDKELIVDRARFNDLKLNGKRSSVYVEAWKNARKRNPVSDQVDDSFHGTFGAMLSVNNVSHRVAEVKGVSILPDGKGDGKKKSFRDDERKDFELIRRVINVHELTAVAIRENTIDECVYRRWFNGSYIDDYEYVRDYIWELRKAAGNPKIYVEFEQTAIRWKNDNVWNAPPGWLTRKWQALKGLAKA